MISVLFSGIAGLYITFYASGGIETKLGFGFLALLWLITTIMAYITIDYINI